MGWEEMINTYWCIPDRTKRICTTVLKMQPIFDFFFKYYELPVKMRIGYKYDELERADHLSNLFKYAYKCGWRDKSLRWVHRWKEIEWRIGEFPLIEDRITNFHIQQYWENMGIDFPKDSALINVIRFNTYE